MILQTPAVLWVGLTGWLKNRQEPQHRFVNPRAGHSLFFPGSLCAHFLTKDRYRSSAHFADFQVRSSLNEGATIVIKLLYQRQTHGPF